MGNLIRAELYRLYIRPWTGIVIAAVLTLSAPILAISYGVTSSPYPVTDLFESLGNLSILGMFFGVLFVFWVSGDVNQLGTLKNEAVFGISRRYMYLSRLCVSLLMGTLFFLALVLWVSILGLCAFSQRQPLLPVLTAYLKGVFSLYYPLWLGGAGLALGLTMALRSANLGPILLLLFHVVGWPVLCALGAFHSPALSNVLSPLWIFYLLHPLTPFFTEELTSSGITFTLNSLTAATPSMTAYCWALGLGWLTLSTLAGIAGLSRKELR